ncbi:MAG: hypothetical protein ACRCYY_14035, partial [Trueperaceae bacterium]
SQRNHIAASLRVWLRLNDLAATTLQTVSPLQHGLLSDYLKQHLRHPSLVFSRAFLYQAKLDIVRDAMRDYLSNPYITLSTA